MNITLSKSGKVASDLAEQMRDNVFAQAQAQANQAQLNYNRTIISILEADGQDLEKVKGKNFTMKDGIVEIQD